LGPWWVKAAALGLLGICALIFAFIASVHSQATGGSIIGIAFIGALALLGWWKPGLAGLLLLILTPLSLLMVAAATVAPDSRVEIHLILIGFAGLALSGVLLILAWRWSAASDPELRG